MIELLTKLTSLIQGLATIFTVIKTYCSRFTMYIIFIILFCLCGVTGKLYFEIEYAKKSAKATTMYKKAFEMQQILLDRKNQCNKENLYIIMDCDKNSLNCEMNLGAYNITKGTFTDARYYGKYNFKHNINLFNGENIKCWTLSREVLKAIDTRELYAKKENYEVFNMFDAYIDEKYKLVEFCIAEKQGFGLFSGFVDSASCIDINNKEVGSRNWFEKNLLPKLKEHSNIWNN